MRWLRVVAAAAVFVGAGALAWPADAATTHNVSMENISFAPANITIAFGDSITWKNNDAIGTAPNGHTATSDTGAFGSPNLAFNSTYTHTFNAAGSYPYHCNFHSSMTGTIVVQAAPTTTVTTRPTPTTARATSTTRRVTTTSPSSTSSSTSSTLFEETTTTEDSTTSTSADIEINEDDGGTSGAAVGLLVAGILAVLGGGGYLLYRLRSGRF